MRFLLISLQDNTHVIGLKYIASSIIKAGHDSRILILPGYRENRLLPSIVKFIKDYNPDLIGIGLLSTEFHNAVRITDQLRQAFRIPIIWGGIHVTLYPEECLKYADYICVGDGEYAIVSLLNHLKDNGTENIPDIPGIWMSRDGKIYGSEEVSPPSELDSLPKQEFMPDYIYCLHRGSIYNLKKSPEILKRYSLNKGKTHITITSRGCPLSCGYCVNAYLADIYGNNLRERQVKECIEELKSVRRHKAIRYISFEDDCFFLHNRKWIEEFSKEYKRHIGLPFIVRVNPQILDRVKLMILRNAGLVTVIVDIKSCSERINREFFQRRISHSYLLLTSQILSDSKVSASYEILAGNPLETEEDRIEAINIMSGLKKPFIIHSLPFTFIPGTPLMDMARQCNITEARKIRYDYLDRLLLLTPYLPRFIIQYLNKPVTNRGVLHSLLSNILSLITMISIKPFFDSFIIARSNHYNPSRTVKALLLRLNTGPAIP
jgi:radical SAM superfamily enzyme YgiQ (UPF0313 family)